MHRRRLQPLLVLTQIQDRHRLLQREASRQIGLELGLEHRNAFRAAPTMPNRVLDHDLSALAAIPEGDLHRVGDGALLRIEIIQAVLLVLYALDLLAQPVYTWIQGDVILVVSSGQAPMN